MPYKLIDLFAGAGGFSLGFLRTQSFELVAAAEIDKKAQLTYESNFHPHHLYSDVKNINYAELKSEYGTIDVVIGGPPCQGFSNANRQHNTLISMNNRLVKEYVRAIQELQPSIFVMENVKMLSSKVHRFIVENTDLANPTIMGLKMEHTSLELLPSDVNCPELDSFFQHPNIASFRWADKFYKTINNLYRYRANLPKLEKIIDKDKSYLLNTLPLLIQGKVSDAPLKRYDKAMAVCLLDYLNGKQNDTSLLTNAIKIPLFLQRFYAKYKELLDNDIHIESIEQKNNALYANVQTYAVADYVKGVLSTPPYNYTVISQLLRAIDYGAPQRRERFMIVGTKPGIRFEFPKAQFTEGHFRTIRDAIEDIEDIPVSTDVHTAPVALAPKEHLSELAKMLRGTKLYNHVTTATRPEAQKRFDALAQGQNFHSLDKSMKSTYSNPERTQNTIYLRLSYDEPSRTVLNVRKSMWEHPTINRAVSIREAARLQTFPDNFIFYGDKNSQYQQVGNAVPPFLSYAVAKEVVKALDKQNGK